MVQDVAILFIGHHEAKLISIIHKKEYIKCLFC